MFYYEVNGDQLKSRLQVDEGGKAVEYQIDLDADRELAVIERFVYANGTREEVIEHRTAVLSLDQLRAVAPHDVDWARAGHVVWAARGMWGIPLEFGPKAEEVIAGETVSI